MRHAPFSAGLRERAWAELGREPFDVVVIGGGITGAGIARDAAGRGLRVLLVDAGDIAGGTSGLSSRLVHGGLRYLETFEFGLVFEALRERRRLLQVAPHLVRPLQFLFPVYRGDPTGLLKLTAGMWLYETLSLLRSPRRHRVVRARGALRVEPALRSDGLVGGAVYFDAQVDDARLTLAVARGAHEAGAMVVTHAAVTKLELGTEGRPGRVEISDGLSERTAEVDARVVVNASGPWSDHVRRLADPEARPRLRLTKGVHILVPRQRLGNEHAVIFRSRVDGRVMFVLPWGDFSYVGTTDTEYSGDPGAATADEGDVRYLLDSANGVFPDARLTPADVLSTWSGVRPLLAPTSRTDRSASQTSREHAVWRDASGLMNIAGGKLTTFRSMAAEVVDEVASVLSGEFDRTSGACYTEYLPLPGAPEESEQALIDRLRPALSPLVDASDLASLVQRHGSDAEIILETVRAKPELGSRLSPDLPYLRAEAIHAVRHEMALTLTDVLRRRLHLCYELPDGGLGLAPDIATLVGAEPELDWEAAEIEAQLKLYESVVRSTRPAR